jgi:hypothetical protein
MTSSYTYKEIEIVPQIGKEESDGSETERAESVCFYTMTTMTILKIKERNVMLGLVINITVPQLLCGKKKNE